MIAELIILSIGCLGVILAQGVFLTKMHRESLEFLKENMQVGGTPLAVAKGQIAARTELDRAKLKAIEEDRAYKRAALQD